MESIQKTQLYNNNYLRGSIFSPFPISSLWSRVKIISLRYAMTAISVALLKSRAHAAEFPRFLATSYFKGFHLLHRKFLPQIGFVPGWKLSSIP